MAGTSIKSFIGNKDLKLWDGIARTFSRLTSTGGSLTQNKVGSVCDVLEVYGDGTAYNHTTLIDAAGAVGSNNVVFLLQPGTWVLSESVTLASNITLQVPRGATLQVAAGKTLTINGNLEAGEYAIFSGTGTIAGTPKIRIKDPTWFSGTETDNLYPSNPYTTWGSASPESAITAPVGSVYLRTTAGSGTTAYYKESGTGNTGWIARTHIGANAIWHAGNDGAGSGLDADTVDGKNPGSVSGIATLDAGLKVVETANQADKIYDGVTYRSASATPAANTIPVSGAASTLARGFIPDNIPGIMTGEVTAKNAGIVTLSGDVQILTMNFGAVTAGDRIAVDSITIGTKGATSGQVVVTLDKASGTATIIFGADDTSRVFRQYVGNAELQACPVSGIIQVTGSGTLVMQLHGTSAASTFTIAAGAAQGSGYFLKKQ